MLHPLISNLSWKWKQSLSVFKVAKTQPCASFVKVRKTTWWDLVVSPISLRTRLKNQIKLGRDGWEMKNVKKQWSWRKQWQLIRLFASKGPTDFRLTCEITEGGWRSYTDNHKLRIMRMLAECYNQHSFVCCTVLLRTQRSYFTCMFLVLWTRVNRTVLAIGCCVSLWWCSH